MPTLPLFWAIRAEKHYGCSSELVSITELSPHLFCYRFFSEALAERKYETGMEVEFRVKDGHFRHYTASLFDPENGLLEIIFETRADGPGTEWVKNLKVGDEVLVIGPGGGVNFDKDRNPIVLGDVNALGLFVSLAQQGHRIIGAVEAPKEDFAAIQKLLPDVAVYEHSPQSRRGDGLAHWLAMNIDSLSPEQHRLYLAGHAPSIKLLRRELRELGWPRNALSLKAHWQENKRGL